MNFKVELRAIHFFLCHTVTFGNALTFPSSKEPGWVENGMRNSVGRIWQWRSERWLVQANNVKAELRTSKPRLKHTLSAVPVYRLIKSFLGASPKTRTLYIVITTQRVSSLLVNSLDNRQLWPLPISTEKAELTINKPMLMPMHTLSPVPVCTLINPFLGGPPQTRNMPIIVNRYQIGRG